MEKRISKKGKVMSFLLCEYCGRWIGAMWMNRHRGKHLREAKL